jgi:glycosyltransferase involved in cell wall biosynthesis
MHKFVIVIPSYKNAQYAQKNILSAISQTHPGFRIIFTDDLSPDNTFEIVQGICSRNKHVNTKLIKNTERKGAMQNLYDMIHSCSPDEIIVTLDGDDWFPHTKILQRLELEYNKGVWLTYGQYKSVSNGNIGASRTIPAEIIQSNGFRKYNWCTTHLRTFYAGLFQKIDENDFKGEDGKFYPMAWDLAMMFPMLEMSGNRISYIPDVLYMYNDMSPINDSKVNAALQLKLDEDIRKKSPYQRIDKI